MTEGVGGWVKSNTTTMQSKAKLEKKGDLAADRFTAAGRPLVQATFEGSASGNLASPSENLQFYW